MQHWQSKPDDVDVKTVKFQARRSEQTDDIVPDMKWLLSSRSSSVIKQEVAPFLLSMPNAERAPESLPRFDRVAITRMEQNQRVALQPGTFVSD